PNFYEHNHRPTLLYPTRCSEILPPHPPLGDTRTLKCWTQYHRNNDTGIKSTHENLVLVYPKEKPARMPSTVVMFNPQAMDGSFIVRHQTPVSQGGVAKSPHTTTGAFPFKPKPLF